MSPQKIRLMQAAALTAILLLFASYALVML